MPHIAVMMYPGRDDETKLALAKRIRLCVADELKLSEQAVTVSMFDIPREDFPRAVEQIPADKIVLGK